MKKITFLIVFLFCNTCFSYDYDVQGYGDGGYVYGNIETNGGGDVDGYLELENGSTVYFDGEFTGYGEIEGYDEYGNYYELEVD